MENWGKRDIFYKLYHVNKLCYTSDGKEIYTDVK